MEMFLKLSTLFVLLLVNDCGSHPIVKTKFGPIQGLSSAYDGKKYEAFLGIPFAEPPLGNLRFELPRPFNSTWSVPFQADHLSDGCFQDPSESYNFNISEDCLYLNVWRPENGENDDELLPVIYFVHGSGYVHSSAALLTNQGDVLAATQGIIVVNSNYRLGAFGFAFGEIDSMPGNVGIHDTLAVLRWIQENIKSFGGDPNRVTLAGQSAGSKMVTLMSTLPAEYESQSLFSRLIMMSGAATNQIHADGVSVALSKTRLLASACNCLSQYDQYESTSPLSDETIACLKAVDANDLLTAQNWKNITALGASEISVFLPVHGTHLIPDRPMVNHEKQIDAVKDKPMLFGAEQDEATMFAAVDEVYTLLDAYSYITDRISYAIKNITTEKIDIMFKSYFDEADPTNPEDIRSRCAKFASDMNYHCPSLILAEFFSQKNSEVHYYLNSYVGESLAESRYYGTKHGDDVRFGFGDPIRQSDSYTTNDQQFSRLLLSLFGDFVKGAHLSDWPAIAVNMNDFESFQVIKQLSLSPRIVVDHDQLICLKWAELFNYSTF